MLLARAGQRVLLLEAGRAGTDTLSTHALMRGGVLQLHRWGLLDTVVAAGTPAIRHTEFHYADEVDTVDVKPSAGVAALRAPRRTVLDPILVAAACAAGATVRHGVRVDGVLHARTRVTGVTGRAGRRTVRATADLVIGADGIRSRVAAAVRAPLRHTGASGGAFVYAHVVGLPGPTDRYRWYYRPHAAAGAIPTNAGRSCVWVSVPAARFGGVRGDLDAGFRTLLAEAAPGLAGEVAAGALDGPVRGFPGQPSYLRAATGPGWALVGDAGWFKDPITAHGITDALRDAELLARAVLECDLGSYEHRRDGLSLPLLSVTDRIASYRWDLTELRELLVELSAAMRPEVQALLGLDAPLATAA
jgi:2-polyprenyl-6-methoxyphenol hydroxylase-like FAD-dependent oxidoreductase